MSEKSGSSFSERNLPLKRKKINKKKQELNEKISQTGQSKITHFFKHLQKKQKTNPNPTQKIITTLKDRLQALKEQQRKLQAEKQQILQQQIESKQQFQQWMRKSKFIIQDSLSVIYQHIRLRKGQINVQKGFYDSTYHLFTQGAFGQQCQEKIEKLQQQIADLDSENLHQRQILEQFLQAQMNKLGHYKKQFQKYKDQLKIAHEEQSCRFADSWPLLANRYQVLELLGKGGFSQVYRAYDLDQNKYVAIKTSSTSGLKSQIAHYIVRQYQNHIKLNHENIAKLYEVVQVTSNSVCIALQFCDGPQLSSYIKQHVRLSQRTAKFILKQILSALLYLSSLNPKIIHFDLKPQNIMFHKGKIKILDFGLSRQIDNEHSCIALSNQGVGTFWYLPPQTFKQKNPQISQKVDIWSAGVIFYEMLFGKKPFGHNKSQTSVFTQGIILQANQVIFPQHIQISEQAKSLIRHCLSYNPSNRCTPAEALSHPFFK